MLDGFLRRNLPEVLWPIPTSLVNWEEETAALYRHSVDLPVLQSLLPTSRREAGHLRHGKEHFPKSVVVEESALEKEG